jgi:hypothetical protein
MHSDSPDDVFWVWFSTRAKDDPKRKNWQQTFAKRLKFGSALSRDWKRFITAGCNPDVLSALLWEITTPAGLDIIDRHRDEVKVSKEKWTAAHKALKALNTSMMRTAGEIAKHLALLNQFYEGMLDQRKRLLLSPPSTNLPNKDKPEVPNDSAVLSDPAFLAAQLSAWGESLSNLISVTQPSKQKITDARRFLPLLKYVSQFIDILPYAPLARLLQAALESARHNESITPDQLRMIWDRSS